MGWHPQAGGVLCLAIVLGGSLLGRSTGVAISGVAPAAIVGEVQDSVGQPVADAWVVALPEAGGVATRTSSDNNGAFSLEALPQQTYRVDVSMPGFSAWRQNHVRVGSEASSRVHAVLSVRPICECLRIGPFAGPIRIDGRVVDQAGRPLPHARLEFVVSPGRDTAYADREGRFVVSPPEQGTWPIVVSDSGFAPVTETISRATTGPLEFRLRFVGTVGVPEVERFNQDCPCSQYFPMEN